MDLLECVSLNFTQSEELHEKSMEPLETVIRKRMKKLTKFSLSLTCCDRVDEHGLNKILRPLLTKT